jgi:hypothetical protein
MTPIALNETTNTDNSDIIINTNPVSDKLVWVFGDSFSIALKPYFSAMFKEVHFFSYTQFENFSEAIDFIVRCDDPIDKKVLETIANSEVQLFDDLVP